MARRVGSRYALLGCLRGRRTRFEVVDPPGQHFPFQWSVESSSLRINGDLKRGTEQAAVKENDTATMDRLLADDFILVTGSGKSYTKAALLDEARSVQIQYEHQEDTDQTVRIWGDTAVITAKLWEKGTNQGKSFDKTVWFSDTYVRTRTGWRYVFGG